MCLHSRLLLFICLIAAGWLSPRTAIADVYWSSPAAACMPEAQAIQSTGYVASAITGAVKPSGTGTIVLICPVPQRSSALLPSVLGLTYRDSTGSATTAQVRAQLIRVNRLTSVRASLATVSSDSNAATGTRLRYSPEFVHQLNFDTALYFVRIELTRSTTNADIRAFGVALESTCGNGQVSAFEQCDDSGNVDGDGCNASCKIETGFQCTGAPSVCTPTAGFCTSASDCPAPASECQTAACTGNSCGFVFAPAGQATTSQTAGDCQQLQCNGSGGTQSLADNTDLPDNTNECVIASCSAGAPQLVPNASGTLCSAGACDGSGNCVSACGDGIIGGAEACDDNDTSSGNGCSNACQVEAGYECLGTPSVCTTTCGDGIIAGSESCDDTGTVSGDGCSNLCTIESGFDCSGSPSICIPQ
jgi:cysteine-rich repeat protein